MTAPLGSARLAITQLAPGVIQAAVWESGFEDSGDAGTLDADAYLRGFGACLGFGLSEADWVAALQGSVTPIPDSLAPLSWLCPAVHCAVLTNNNMLVQRHFFALYPEVSLLVGQHAFVSTRFGARKPDADV